MPNYCTREVLRHLHNIIAAYAFVENDDRPPDEVTSIIKRSIEEELSRLPEMLKECRKHSKAYEEKYLK